VFASPNKLKLGIFGVNLSGGSCGVTLVDGPLKLNSWQEVEGIVRRADDAGIEALIPVGRWKGFGGPRGYWDRSFETFTWAAGVAAATRNIQIFTTCHVGVIHPIAAAKMGATVDAISGGRWGLNVVTGFLGEEFEMFGTEGLAPQPERYRLATEWLQIVKRLWQESDPFDFDGEFFHLKDAVSLPHPVQAPRPVVMNAGSSSTGAHFASTECDMVFVQLGERSDVAAKVEELRAAAAGAGRDITVWGIAHIVARDTEKEAQDFRHYYADEHGDFETAQRFVAKLMRSDSGATQELVSRESELVKNITSTSGNWGIVGSFEQVVEELAGLSEVGVDGVGMVFPDYLRGISDYSDKLLPLMKEAGLRTS
jgi:alkanesulfonate monooxygenase SsuD/methylene tetrahydromethanopterin reductase-like flavin-dependent oxidoreductase (luciferase family)